MLSLNSIQQKENTYYELENMLTVQKHEIPIPLKADLSTRHFTHRFTNL